MKGKRYLREVVTLETAEGITVRATADYYPSDPGRLYGPMEDCYPPTDAEAELYGFMVGSAPYTPTEEEIETWTTDILENPENYFSRYYLERGDL